MSDIIKMDYPKMEAMRQSFVSGADVLEDVQKRVIELSKKAEGGVFLGEAGETFSNALSFKLYTSVRKLRDKFEELAEDIQAAVDSMEAADNSTTGTMG